MYKDFSWVNEPSDVFLGRDYLLEGQTVQSRVRQISERFGKLYGDEEMGDKFYDYVSRGFYSLSSPIWSNYGTERGTPVSCFNSHFDDSMESILFTAAEVGMLSKFGGGTSGYINELRPRGTPIKDNGKSSGAVHFMEIFDTMTNVVSQGSVRRGHFSPYMDIEHGDFDEFVTIGTDEHHLQGMKHGVCVSDDFMKRVEARDPEACRRWGNLLKARSDSGTPYIFFTDTVNNNKPQVYIDNDMQINGSNMCSEIALPSSSDESFVCVLSSMNIETYDEWKETDAVEVLTYFLDTVVTEFLNRTEDMSDEVKYLLKRVIKFCKRHRALGLGVLGWHSYLMKNSIPFESREAAKLNLEIAKFLHNRTNIASSDLADRFGEPELMKGTGFRNTTLMAIAPTKSSSFILGQVSQSVEPEFSNYYVKDTAKMKITWSNPHLSKVLETYGKDDKETWASIKEQDGSVQHLDFLSKHEKDVFKTLYEMNQETLIDQAAVRQPYIDQAQSINILVDPKMHPREINALYFRAWKLGLKTLYYQYPMSAAQSFMRERAKREGCVACEA